MTNIQKTLKTAGIWCLVASGIYILTLVADIFLIDFSLYNVILDGVSIVLAITTAVTYLCFSKKSKETILKNKSIFLVFSILNIFTTLIVWFISFWVQTTVARELRTDALKNAFYNQTSNQTTGNTNNPDTIILTEDDYEIKQSAQTLSSKLEELKNLKAQNLITEEEYEKLRQEAINNFMK